MGSEDGASGKRGASSKYGEEFSGGDPAGAEGGETDTLAGGAAALPNTTEQVVRFEAASGPEPGVVTDGGRSTMRA